MQATAHTPVQGEYITVLFPDDVLFGRGSGPNDHEGNIRFRSLVSERKEEYMSTNHRQTKAKIAREIVNHVLNKNGRFLKKVEAADAKRLGVPKGADAWCMVDEETIMEKAKQALRQQREKGKSYSPNNSPVPSARKSAALPPSQVQSRVEASLPYGASQNAMHPLTHEEKVSAHLAAAYASQSAALPPSQVQSRVEADLPYGASQNAMLPLTHEENVSAHLAAAYASQLVPNPYEPVPIGNNAVVVTDPGDVDWRDYTNSVLMSGRNANSPVPPPQVDVSNVRASDNSRRESIQVSDLMDSFNKMKTKEFRSDHESNDTMGTIGTRNDESTDTMGTIEHISVGPGSTLLGLSGMSSSTFSLMKGPLQDSARTGDSVMLKGSLDSVIDSQLFRSESTLRSSITSKPSESGGRRPSRGSIHIHDHDFFKNAVVEGTSGMSQMSMSLSHVFHEKRALGDLTEGDEDTADESQKKLPGQQGQQVNMDDDLDNMSGLGKSSMSILNVAMGESNGEASIMTANESIFSDIGD